MSSDEEFEENETIEEKIDLFIHTHSHSILLLSEDLRNRFSYFITKAYSFELIDFLMNCKLRSFQREYSYIPYSFIQEYNTEIDTTLFVVNNFLHCYFRKFQISKNDWIDFCFTTTE